MRHFDHEKGAGEEEGGTFLCKLKDLPLGTARGISLGSEEGGAGEGADDAKNTREIILWHHKTGIKAFENACPHLNTPLETFPNRFLTQDGTALICSTHGARFTQTGHCFSGPCQNKYLTPLNIHIEKGNILLA